MRGNGSENGSRASRGISAADAQEFLKSYCESGVENLHSARCAAREIVDERLEQIFDEAEAVSDRGELPTGHEGSYERLDQNEAERQLLVQMFHPAYPTWQQISGLFPKQEREINPNERARRIRILLASVERLLRHEMKHGADVQENLSPARYVDHSLQWNPLRTICFHMELAQQRLSAYSREQTGMSAPEVVDCIRAEDMRGKMKAQLRTFVTGFFSRKDAETQRERNGEGETGGRGENGNGGPHPRPLSHTGKGENGGVLADEIWAALKESRKGPRWHRTIWAAGFGFSSYSKFFRACVLCYGKTPHQLEMELIDEILAEAEPNNNGSHEEHDEELREHEQGLEEKAETVKRE
jgi:hypothetical protein